MTFDPRFLTVLSCAASMILSAAGSAYASSHSSVYAMRGSGIEGFIPIVISGALALYRMIISIVMASSFSDSMTPLEGYRNLVAGLSVGFACLASGFGMATFIKEINLHHAPPSSSLPQYGSESKPLIRQERSNTTPVDFNYLLPCMTFLEAIGLYGFVVALYLMGAGSILFRESSID